MKNNVILKFCLVLLLVFPAMASAALNIEIVGGAASQIPIAVVPFAQSVTPTDSVSTVVTTDLRRSGLFKTLETRGVALQPHEINEVKYGDWAALQAQAMVIGKVEPLPNGRFKVSFRLLDVVKQSQLAGVEYEVAASQLRSTAHKIADVIYEKLTGERGDFSTRIAYINKMNGRYVLQVADADGGNPQTMLSGVEPIISPAWSPDGTSVAYVSFEKKKPIIYIQSLMTGQRIVLANYKGNNSAPAWSPDGKRLAIVLTHGANSQIYVINSDGTGLQQLSHSSTIDTEPDWSPDGKWIYFTSDRGGSPQIYRMSPLGGDAKRVTFDGSYNVSPRLSPDGKLMAYIRRDDGKFHVAVLDLQSNQVQTLSESTQDESPSFSPNGRMILYATNIGGKGVLAAVSSDGKVKQRLSESGGDVREPAWSPQ